MRFDWSTLLLQTINVLVLIWLLRRFLFRPVLDIIVARKEAAEKLLADAAAERERAQSEAEKIARGEAQLAADRNHILADAHAAAESERAQLFERANHEAAEAREAALSRLEQERQQMRRELEAEARSLAVTIASRLLDRVPSRALNAAMLQSLDTWLGSLPSEPLRHLSRSDGSLEVVTAAPLDTESQTACAEILERRLGSKPALRFSCDPSLIAGIELRGSETRIRNSWRADLDQVAVELSRDDKTFAVA